MKLAAIAFVASLAVASGAAAQDGHQDHAGHAGHGDHAGQAASGHGDHQHDPAHYATAMHAEHVLRDTITALQAGTPDYDTMVPQLADAVRQQSAAMTPGLQSLGELQSLEHIGQTEGGAHQFRGTFANGQTTWTISINAENKIQGLFVQ